MKLHTAKVTGTQLLQRVSCHCSQTPIALYLESTKYPQMIKTIIVAQQFWNPSHTSSAGIGAGKISLIQILKATTQGTPESKMCSPVTKQLQSHEGEHEDAEHEEQEDVRDLWQRVSYAAEYSPDLPRHNREHLETKPRPYGFHVSARSPT